GVFLWQGFGPGEGELPETGTGPGAATEAAGDPGTGPGTLKGDAGVQRSATADGGREAIQPEADRGAAARVALTGRLVHSDGTPGAGLGLRYLGFSGSGLVGGLGGLRLPDPAAPLIKTDDDGRFHVSARANSSGYLSLAGGEAVFQSKDLGDVLILTAARVSGQVVDPTGSPVAGVSVTSRRDTSAIALALGDGKKTDKDGRFELAGLQPGEHNLVTRSAEHLPAQQKVQVTEGQHLEDVLIRVQPGGFIVGTVVDDLGQAVAGADVVASRTQQLDPQLKITSFSPGESTRTDASGRFRLANLDTEKATLRVTKTGLATEQRDIVVGTTDVTIELQRLGAIEGVLVDEHSKPVAGSRISIAGGWRGLANMMALERGATITDETGRFRLESVRPGRPQVRARGDSHLPVTSERVRVRPGETTKGVRMIAVAGVSLEVLVVGADGQPVANADVTVKEKAAGGPMLVPPGGRRRERGQRRIEYRAIRRERNGPVRVLGGGNTLGKGKTDARGKVTIGGLPAGEVLVGAKHKELALVRPQDLVLPERGKASTRLTMRRGGFLAVRAVDSAGRPVANARFEVTGPTVSGEEPRSREESCDGDGKARVGPFAAGEYSAVLLADQRPRTAGGMSITLASMEPSLDDSKVTLQVREGDTAEVVLRKPVLTTVRGTVRDQAGPVKRAEVALTREGDIRLPLGNGLEARTDADGNFEITGVPSGKYKLSWGRRSAIVPSEDEIQLQKDQPELVRHLVIPGAVVKLRAWNPEDDEPVEDAEVTLSRIGSSNAPGQGPQRRTRMQVRMIGITNRGSGPQRVDMSAGNRSASTDEDGLVVIKDVPPGKYELEIQHRRHATHQEEIEVLGDATLDLGTRKLTAGGAVSGRILFEDANQLQMANVELSTLDGKDTNTTFSADGRF
ncbi:MAG: carboxypeptidase regulatory-like domain-containing protein, partial [Planctomycetota bacterium]